MRDLKGVYAYLRPYWLPLSFIVLLSLVGTILGLAYPLFAKVMIDTVIRRIDWDLLVIVSVGMFAATLGGYFVSSGAGYLQAKVVCRLLLDLRFALYRRLLRLSILTNDRMKVGEICFRLNNDIATVQSFATGALLGGLSVIVRIVAAAVAMIFLSPNLFLVSIAILPFSIIGVKLLRGPVRKRAEEVRDTGGAVSAFLVEAFSNVRLLKSFSLEADFEKRYLRKADDAIESTLRFQRLSIVAGFVDLLITALSAAALFLYGGSLVLAGEMTVGDIVAFAAYQQIFLGSSRGVLGLYLSYQQTKVSLDRIGEIFALPQETVASGGGEKDALRSCREARFDNITYRYPEGDFALEGLSFSVEKGEIVAIAGPSGEGKTTLVSLLFRFIDPQEGRILLDGKDIRDIDLADLRRSIGMMCQEPMILQGTIEENIRLGKLDAVEAEIVAAARSAGIHDFIAGLPSGYNTEMLERGANLSEGQKQRIALARIFLKNPRILVLDEPTASLDPETESDIMRALDALRRDRMILLVTHREPLLKWADRIVVVEGGRIVGEKVAL